MAESYPGGHFRFKWGGKRHREEIAQGEKCEPLAPVAAQSERLPMWKGLTVNSPLRWAWSRGNASQSPACSPTWEQLQPPSASSSWRLPEGSASHPSSLKSEAPLLRQRGFSLFDEISENPSLVCIQYMRACLHCWNAHWHRKKKRKKHSQHIFLYTSEIILIRVGHNWSKQSPDFSQILPVNGACEHLCQVSSALSNSLCWSADAVKRVSCLRSKTPQCTTEERQGRWISHSIQ